MQKSATFQQERFLFLFNFSKISCSKHKGISLNLRATYALNALQKLMNTKTSSYLLMQQHNLQAKKQMKKR
jgi:hypothetical protein